MVVRLYGIPQIDINGHSHSDPDYLYTHNLEADTYYMADTAFGLKRLPNAPDSNDYLRIYKDNQGDLYSIRIYSNTLTNLTQNRYKTWTDVELLKNS
jgi:hypothetical protein